MDWQWWCIFLALSTTTRGSDCPEGASCSSCQIYPEGLYSLDCITGTNDVIKVDIRPNVYVKLTCRNSVNWTEFNLGLSDRILRVNSLYFSMCNLPEANGLETIANQLLVDDIEILSFASSDLTMNSSLNHESLRGFNGLKMLTLTDNNLSELPEDLLQNLTNLRVLILRGNNLRHLPKRFFRSGSLEKVELGINKLEILEPSAFEKPERLRLFNVWNNKLVKILPHTFDKFVSLETLDLQRNFLVTLPSGIFAHLRNLTTVNLSQNNFTQDSLPDDLLRNCPNLTTVTMMENKRNMTTLPNAFFANMTKLKSVKLRKNGFLWLPEDLFQGATNLRNLSIERNYLPTLPEKIFSTNTELYILELSFNDFSHLPENVFSPLSKLVKLDLSKNHLKTIPKRLFATLSSLRELNMERNDIVSIDSHAFLVLQRLRIAKFSYNSLSLQSEWSERRSPFHYCEDLEEVHMGHNNISDIFQDWVYSTRLRVLDLSYNRLQSLEDLDLQFLSENINVDLTHNNITHIDLNTVDVWAINRSDSRNVIVSIENNPLHCDCKLYDLLRYLEGRLNPNVQKAFHLKVGKLSCPGPHGSQTISIESLQSKTLQCHANTTTLKSDCPKHCECYVRPENKAFLINCANVGLKEAPRAFDSPPGFNVELNLSGNYLTITPNLDRPGYDRVTILALDHNNISAISLGTLSPKLEVLKLNNNNLTRVDQGVIDYLNSTSYLREFTLGRNPWSCDCDSRHFLNFVQTRGAKIPDLTYVTCPGKELPIFQMTPEELCPPETGWIVGVCLVVASLSLTIGSLAALYYRYQREVKVWLYAKNWCLWFVTEDELDKDKLYDAFISFSHKDEDFVVNEFIPKLETEPRPFKLCVHYRDWLAGEWIPKQIARSVDESRRTIVVLSPNFLESVWGRMEFRAAHSQALSEGRARVIVVLYGDIGPTDDLDPELKAYLSMNTYVKWGDPWFWQKLKYAMPHPTEFANKRLRRNIFQTSQPRSIVNSDDKSELINFTGAPSTPPIATTPPAESVKIFIGNGVKSNELDKSSNDKTRVNDQPIANREAKKNNVRIPKIQCTTV